MSGISGPKLNGPRVSIDPPGRLAGDEPVIAPKQGHDPIKARIGRDAPEGSGPPARRPNPLARNAASPAEHQSTAANLGASSVSPVVQFASKPRVTFNLDANTVRHFEIADGARLNPTRPKAPAPPAPRAPTAPSATAGSAELYADWHVLFPKPKPKGNFLSRLFTPKGGG